MRSLRGGQVISFRIPQRRRNLRFRKAVPERKPYNFFFNPEGLPESTRHPTFPHFRSERGPCKSNYLIETLTKDKAWILSTSGLATCKVAEIVMMLTGSRFSSPLHIELGGRSSGVESKVNLMLGAGRTECYSRDFSFRHIRRWDKLWCIGAIT